MMTMVWDTTTKELSHYDLGARRWEVEWYTEPVRPASVTDEEWAVELDNHGPDLAVCHARTFRTKAAALKFARAKYPISYFGQVRVTEMVPHIIEPGVMDWDATEHIDYIDEMEA